MFKYVNDRIQSRFTWIDLKFMGSATALIGIALADFLPVLNKVNPLFYLGAAVLMLIRPYIKLLKK